MPSLAQVAKTQLLVHRVRAAHSHRRQLWNEAAKSLPDSDIPATDQELIEGRDTINTVQAAVQDKLDECIRKRWKYTRSNGQKVVLWDVLDKIMKWVNKFKSVGDIAVQYDPGHAALPWAAIRLILQASVSHVETFGHMLEGVELSSRIIAIYAEVERACLKGVSILKTQLADALVKMYAAVLAFLSRARQYFAQSSGKRLLKGAFQSHQTSVSPSVERISNAEKDVLKLVGLVQSEDQKNLLVTTRRAVLDLQNNRSSSKVPKHERRRLVHGWLEAVSTAETFQKAQMVRHEKTCTWIFTRPEYQEWESTDVIVKPKILWIHSGPGFGKTVLCAKIIDHMLENDIPLVHFFCVADDETRRQPYAILRSWIDQLTRDNEDALDIAYEMYQSIETRPPTSTELWRLFKTLGKAITCTFVVDGFDECSTINKISQRHTTDGRSEFLEHLIKNAADTRVRVLILSRDNEDIRAQLETLTRNTVPMLLEYGISINDTRGDIDHCSSDMINTRLANKSKELKEYLISEAARKSDGMFLWLHLLSRELDPGENAKGLRNIVSEMPAEINETYERDLEKVKKLKPPQKARAMAILRWILFAMRPLTVRELAEAVAATVDDTAETYPHDDLPDSWEKGYVDEQYVNSYIRRSCGSLVELRGQNDNKPLALHTVHFVHFSVKEYLLRTDDLNNGQSRLESICFPNGGIEHNRLARLCLQYLCYDVFGEKKSFEGNGRIQVYPFLAYAAKSWYMHALHDHRMSEDIMPWAEKLFNPSTSNWILWSRVFEGELELNDEPSPTGLQGDVGFSIDATDESETLGKEKKPPSPIYYAALLGLTDIVKALQSQGLDCNAPGGIYGFPLQAAVRNSHQDTVEYLIQQGVDVNQRGGLYSLAICAAAAQGLDGIMDVLVKAGADRTGEDDDGRNCLHFACKQGARATIKPLLEAGLDPMKKSKLGKSPFYEAIESGDHETISLMLETGASANDVSSEGTTAIMRAVSLGHREIVQELIHHHADVNLSDPKGLTCLHEAVVGNYTAIIHTLLDNAAEINARDEDGWTALNFAVAQGETATAELLIGRGAHVSTSTNGGWTSLHIAAEEDDEKMMAILLEKGAEVDAENSSSETSLCSAVWARSLSCAMMLLAHGASVAKINNLGNTILEEAFEAGAEDIVECLLDSHALIGPADHREGTEACSSNDVQRTSFAARLSKTILQGDEDLAFHLIYRDELVLSQRDIDIALLSCSLFNAPSLAKCLLDKGTSLATSTYNKRTPLHLAAKFNFLELTQIFTKNNSSNWMVDISGYTPLDLSLARGLPNFETTKYLVELGALATQGSSQDMTPVIRTDSILEGFWEGTYTYSSWNKGVVDPTAMTIQVAPHSQECKHPVWTCNDEDEAGEFKVLGHLLADNTIRFLKLYDSIGWLYLGVFDADALTIRGTWGSNMTVRHGSFEMKKVEARISER